MSVQLRDLVSRPMRTKRFSELARNTVLRREPWEHERLYFLRYVFLLATMIKSVTGSLLSLHSSASSSVAVNHLARATVTFLVDSDLVGRSDQHRPRRIGDDRQGPSGVAADIAGTRSENHEGIWSQFVREGSFY